jgi:hypothetical protein
VPRRSAVIMPVLSEAIAAEDRHVVGTSGHRQRIQGWGRWLATPAGGFVLLVGAYVASATYLAVQAGRVRSYIWLIDELLYTKIAQGFARGALFGAQVYGHSYSAPNALYPRLLAPLYWLLNSTHAFTAAHVLNGLVFASTIFPVYLLSRRLRVPPPLAVLAGLMSVLIPWAVATAVLMSESLAYPLFAWAIFAIVVAAADASLRNDALALIAIALAAYARTQFAALFAVLALAIVLHEIGFHDFERDGTPRRADLAGWWRPVLRGHLALFLALASGLVAVLVLRSTGHDPFGSYGGLLNGYPFPPDLWGSATRHLAHVFVGVGLVPPILWFAWSARTLGEPQAKIEHACAVVFVLAVTAVIYEAAFIAQTAAGGQIQERYVFYLAPLLFVGAVHLLARPPTRAPRLATLLGGLAVAAVVGADSFSPDETSGAFTMIQNASAGFNGVLDQRLGQITADLFGHPWPTVNTLALVAVLLAVLAAGGLSMRRRTLAAILLLGPVLAFTVTETNHVLQRTIPAINTWFPRRLSGVSATPRSWIDGVTYGRGSAGLLPGDLRLPDSSSDHWLWTEFWNKSITVLYLLPGESDSSGLPGTPMQLDLRTGRLVTSDQPPYLVVSGNDLALGVRGELVHRSTYGAALLRPERPYRATWTVTGGANGAAQAGSPLKLLVFPDVTPSVERVTVDVVASTAATGRLRVDAVVGNERLRTTLVSGVVRRFSFRMRLMPTAPPTVVVLRVGGRVTRAPATQPNLSLAGVGVSAG